MERKKKGVSQNLWDRFQYILIDLSHRLETSENPSKVFDDNARF